MQHKHLGLFFVIFASLLQLYFIPVFSAPSISSLTHFEPSTFESDNGMCDYQGYLSCFCRQLALSCHGSFNNLTENDPIWNRFEVHNNITLFELYGESNTFEYIPKGIFKYFSSTLQQLNFQRLSILSLNSGTIENLPELEELSLNDCAELQFTQPGAIRALPKLKKVSISQSRLSLLENFFQNVPSLRDIYLENNQLARIKPESFKELDSLQYLSLINNKLSNIQREWFIGLLSLVEIDFTQNKITSLPENVFAEMPSLKRLFLSENQIENIHPKAFAGLVNVREINLEENRISQLPSTTVFRLTPKLELLNLGKNKFEYLDGKVFYQPSNKRFIRITIRGNQLQCTCGLLWMEEALKTIFDSMIQSQLEKMYCRTDKIEDKVLMKHFNETANLSPQTVMDFLKNSRLMNHCRELTDVSPFSPLPDLPKSEVEDFVDSVESQNNIEPIEDLNSINEKIDHGAKLSLENPKSSSSKISSKILPTTISIFVLKFLTAI